MSESESFIIAASYFSRGDFRRLGVPIWGGGFQAPTVQTTASEKDVEVSPLCDEYTKRLL
jgi:hypothetical protein